MFAIDGYQLPSSVSNEWSGTKKELHEKYEKHQQNDSIEKKELEADKKT